jgi:hypothetical protein
MIPAELAITEAVDKVERLGAHTLLTDAVILLGQARDKVADWYERDACERHDQEDCPTCFYTTQPIIPNQQ